MIAKRLFSLTIIISILSLVIAGCSTSSSNNSKENETITLKLATYVPVTSQVYKYVTEPWMKRVTELTDGKVQFDTYPGEQLGKAQDMLKLTRDGVTDIGVFPANYFPDNMPLTNALAGLPNLSMTSHQGTAAYNELLQQNKELLETDFSKNGLVPILGHVSPTYEIWTTKKEVRVPADLKGLKTRTVGGVANEVYEYMGAVPVTVSHTETYEALEKGVIEGAGYSSVAVEASGTSDLLKYATFPHIGTAIHGLVVNEKVWNGLPEDVQKAMKEAGQELIEQSGKEYDQDTEAFNKEFSKTGTIVELTDEEKGKWEKVTKEFTEKWLKEQGSKDFPYEEVLKQYKESLEKYK
ncbi:TRAP transporter substrate-binding protein DctP [Peribacillus asahii]|uniref:TRAP transporter substrate-binding protein n=1 Tax=Peribacillus asahii TaxID=228899 RepID=UPI00207A7468|nr:TRAP transporter substrate-binding protein DctP [Peribacillus asahii]USK72124.1 TRAP transporter substrate-binding protein DctP [Peribacillus asahii]